ncbi:MAG: DNA topoisomerase I [Candidatus Pacearchaeota archaeon]
MPKKRIKTKAETSAEQFFPIDKNDLKQAIEKVVKPINQPNILTETPGIIVGKTKKKSVSVKKSSLRGLKSNKEIKSFLEEFNNKNIQLKQGGYELIITEKPQAAMKIASALGRSTPKSYKGVTYYEVDRGGKRIVVACAVGHLFTLKQSQNNNEKLPIFDIFWVPNYLVIKKDFSKKYYDTLKALVKNAGSITIATDYDIEGEVIGLNVVRFIAGQKDANRMKFSTLTKEELNKAYENKNQTLDWGQAIAGETRHFLDWYYGINLSRALMNAMKSIGKFRVFSIGRVQGPTLNLIVEKEKEILSFKPQPYWQIFIILESPEIELKYVKDVFNKSDLEKFKNLKNKIAEVSTEKVEQKISPPFPFNLTNLQTEAYNLYGINPSTTLKVAQSLYLSGLISYPRTSSQKLPSSIAYKDILKKLAEKFNVEGLIKRGKPFEGPKSDPAHPSIYPTGNFQSLDGDEEKIYNLIAKRFLALFCEDAIIENKTIRARVQDLIFIARGSSIKNKGWMSVYPNKMVEKYLPDLNGKIKIATFRIEEKQTQPPRRYSPASIIAELEKRNLGTKATRAAILETLYDRGYIKEKSIEVTPLGMAIIDSLKKHSPIIIDEKLTRDFEKDMDSIIKSKKDLQKKQEKIKEKAKEIIKKIIDQFEKEGKEIGQELVKAQEKSINLEKEKNKITKCPNCTNGVLTITYSKKNKRYFIACNAYPNCKTTFSLPLYGLIKKIEPEKICEKCGFPMLMSIQKGKRPWVFCFNPNCPKNKERLEKNKEKTENNKS